MLACRYNQWGFGDCCGGDLCLALTFVLTLTVVVGGGAGYFSRKKKISFN